MGISSRKGVAVLCVVIVIVAVCMVPVVMAISRRNSYKRSDSEQLSSEPQERVDTSAGPFSENIHPAESPTALPLYEPRYEVPEAPPPAYRTVIRPEKSNN